MAGYGGQRLIRVTTYHLGPRHHALARPKMFTYIHEESPQSSHPMQLMTSKEGGIPETARDEKGAALVTVDGTVVCPVCVRIQL